MRRGLLLVEGQTEERFAKDLLCPHLLGHGLALDVTVIPTKKVLVGKDFKGGVTDFGQIKKAMTPLLNSGGALVTTLFDYYRLPSSVPGMADRHEKQTPVAKVQHVQMAIEQYFGSPPHLKVFLALHEFEALLFTGPEDLALTLDVPRLATSLAAISAGFDSPEAINERPELSPSRRIIQLAPGYVKSVDGPNAANRIGLGRIRAACPHFNAWLTVLEQAGSIQ